jgi:PIN domain nuclease of toxin-antitoxin system
MIVFDSSALLACARDETGGDFVNDLIEEADVPKFVHSANLCEVYHLTWRLEEEQGGDGRTKAENVVRDLLQLGIEERSDMDAAFWRDAGELIALRRLAGASLALGDAFGVALARRLDAQFVTADRAEIEPLRAAGLVDALFIR